jgi:hypothetical protein
MIRLNALFLGVTLARPAFLVSAVALVSEGYRHNSSPSFLTERRARIQDSDPRVDDLDFRWEMFWGSIWKSMGFYVFVAEVWLAVESWFGLGKVALRPPISPKRS